MSGANAVQMRALHHSLEPRMRADDVIIRIRRRHVKTEVALAGGSLEPVQRGFSIAKAKLDDRNRKQGHTAFPGQGATAQSRRRLDHASARDRALSLRPALDLTKIGGSVRGHIRTRGTQGTSPSRWHLLAKNREQNCPVI